MSVAKFEKVNLFFTYDMLRKQGRNRGDKFCLRLEEHGFGLILDFGFFVLFDINTFQTVHKFKTEQELWDFLPLYVPNVWSER